MIPPAPYWPKDFSLVKKDGVYHLFYIRRNVNLPAAETENDFGHAESYDLVHWTQRPPVLATRDSSWDNAHVWAPSVVLRDSVYWMFYCGVTGQSGFYNSYQRIGVATSTDLENWNRLDAPVFSCDQVPWAFCDSLNALTGFRDPFVMPDPGTPGNWLMYYTANADSDSTNMVVGVASSSGDFTQWSDVKPLWDTYRATSGSGVAESPHLFLHDGLWYRFTTANGTQPIAFATSPDPLADPSGWTPRGRLGDMLGYYTGSWFASEHLQDGLVEYFAWVNGDRIEMYRMAWSDTARFSLVQPDLFHVTDLRWEADTVRAGHDVNLRFAAVNWFNRMAPIETRLLDSLGEATAVAPESLGLPSLVPIYSDTTRWTWTARLWPPGSSGPMRLAVRLPDQTASTPRAIIVLPDTLSAPPDSFRVTRLFWSADTVRRGDTAYLGIVARHGVGRSIALAAFTADSLGSLTSVPLDSLGLPAQVTLTGDTTSVTWASRTWPDSVAPHPVTRVVVANESLATAPPLTVLPEILRPRQPRPVPIPPRPPSDDDGLILKAASTMRAGGEVAFLVGLPEPMDVRLELFDIQGRRVSLLAERRLARGATVIAWDGRRSDGSAAGAGVYFARLTTPNSMRIARTVLLP
ncbi:MAG: family 43 glycosylhydrolase [Candidatus Eisenbacteria bacterium]|nr:family 43 glycosylhydrolase [Candidatus Eisenbacteria bacterium]